MPRSFPYELNLIRAWVCDESAVRQGLLNYDTTALGYKVIGTGTRYADREHEMI